jgi:hypothetical protein
MEGNCRKGFAVVWFLYLSTCEGKWNGSQKVLMLEDNGPYLLLSALILFLLLDLFPALLSPLLPFLKTSYSEAETDPPLLLVISFTPLNFAKRIEAMKVS